MRRAVAVGVIGVIVVVIVATAVFPLQPVALGGAHGRQVVRVRHALDPVLLLLLLLLLVEVPAAVVDRQLHVVENTPPVATQG